MQQHISFQGKFQEVFLPGTRERQNVEVMGWRYNYDYDGLQKQPGARGPCLGQQHRFYSPQRVVAIWKRASVPVETRLQRPPLPPPTSLLVLEVVLLDQFQVVHKLVVLFAVGALRENGPLGKGERVHIPNGPPACARNSQSARGRGRGGWRTRQIAGRCTQPSEPPQNPLARRTRRRGLAHTHTRTRARAHTHTHTHTLSLSLSPPPPFLDLPHLSQVKATFAVLLGEPEPSRSTSRLSCSSSLEVEVNLMRPSSSSLLLRAESLPVLRTRVRGGSHRVRWNVSGGREDNGDARRPTRRTGEGPLPRGLARKGETVWWSRFCRIAELRWLAKKFPMLRPVRRPDDPGRPPTRGGTAPAPSPTFPRIRIEIDPKALSQFWRLGFSTFGIFSSRVNAFSLH